MKYSHCITIRVSIILPWIIYMYASTLLDSVCIYIYTNILGCLQHTHIYIYTRTIYVLVHWQRNFVVFWPSFLLFKSPTLATSIWAFLGLQECMHRVKQRCQRCQRCIEARVVSSGGRWEVGLSLRQINLYGFMDLPQPWTGRK